MGATAIIAPSRAGCTQPGKPNLPRPVAAGGASVSGGPMGGRISEKVFADINGVRQGMFIQGNDAAHPVLLCLHAGLPEYFLTERYPTGLEDDFTVVWWER
jgi:hypothetical protein